MSKEHATSWWGSMPRVMSSLGLWTTPEEGGVEGGDESEKENMEDFVEKRRRSIRERDLTPFDGNRKGDRTENGGGGSGGSGQQPPRRSNSIRSRSRSRSSSMTSQSAKRVEPTSKKVDTETTPSEPTPKIDGGYIASNDISKEISNIKFSFFGEENKSDLALLNNRSEDHPEENERQPEVEDENGPELEGEKSEPEEVIDTKDDDESKESPTTKSLSLESSKKEKECGDESDDQSFSSTFSSNIYERVNFRKRQATIDSEVNENRSPPTDGSPPRSPPPFDIDRKRRSAEEASESEYSVPKRSSSPIYSSINKVASNKESDEPATVVTAMTVVKPERPEVPEPDWTPSTASSETAAADFVRVGKPDGSNCEEDESSYCQHRATMKTNMRRLSLLRYRRNKSSIQVRSKVDRFWKYVRKWWVDERTRMNETFGKYKRKTEKRSSPETGNGCILPSSIQVRTSFDGEAARAESALSSRDIDDDDDESFDTFTEDEYNDEKLEVDTQVSLPIDIGRFRDHRKSSLSTVTTAPSMSTRPSSALSSGFMNRSLRSLIAKKGGFRSSSEALAFRRSKIYPEGQSGFDDLKRYIKQGGDFCKDLSAILQERSEAETQYAKTLSKLSAKLLKASKEAMGTVNHAWQCAGVEMETQSEIHRAFATALSEEVVKPLKLLVESQHRIRKSVETAVDKTGKSLSEWRAAEIKSKKQSFISARENEKLQDAMLDVRLGNNVNKLSSSTLHLHSQRPVSDKESNKLESKRKKAEESVKKSDVEYYTYCVRAERARLEWETAVVRGSHCFQALEEERLTQLKNLANCYLRHFQDIGPKLTQSTERLKEPVESCDVVQDIQSVISLKGTGQPVPEQLLPDFYAEHMTLAMNRERRKQALVKLLHLIRQDLERERRGIEGVENLARALRQQPTFGAEESQQNVTEKLHHMRSMLTYLDASRYKLSTSLADLEGRAKPNHPLASHISVTRDRQGLQQSILKVPAWVHKDMSLENEPSNEWTDRGAADGNSVQPDSDFDEFSSQGSEHDYQSSVISQYPVMSEPTTPCSITNGNQCKALYHYTANLYDELNLEPGDVINIHEKQPDGWWLGELNGVVGIFPATYVEEIK